MPKTIKAIPNNETGVGITVEALALFKEVNPLSYMIARPLGTRIRMKFEELLTKEEI